MHKEYPMSVQWKSKNTCYFQTPRCKSTLFMERKFQVHSWSVRYPVCTNEHQTIYLSIVDRLFCRTLNFDRKQSTKRSGISCSENKVKNKNKSKSEKRCDATSCKNLWWKKVKVLHRLSPRLVHRMHCHRPLAPVRHWQLQMQHQQQRQLVIC